MTQEKALKYIELSIEVIFLLIVLFAPVYFDRRIGIVFSLSKATWIRALTMILLGLLVTKAFTLKKEKMVRTALDLPVMTYMLCATAAVLLSINVYISFIGSYGRYEGLITLFNYGAIFFLTTNILTDENKRSRVMVAAVMASVVMSVYGLVQRLEIDPYAWGGVLTSERVIATIGQPNFLAAYLDMAFIMGLLIMFSLKNAVPQYRVQLKAKGKKQPASYKWDTGEILSQLKLFVAYLAVPAVFIFTLYHAEGNAILIQWLLSFLVMFGISIYFTFNFQDMDRRLFKGLLVLSLCLVFLGILSTQSRGGWFGLACGLGVFFIICGRKVFIDNRNTWILIAVVCILVTGFSFMKLGSQQAQRFLGEINVSQKSGAPKLELKGAAGSRLETWTSALHFIPDRPVFGVGPEVIKMVFPQYETALFRFKEGFHVKQDRCHNETLDMTVTRGLVTLAVYIILLFQVYYYGIKKARRDKAQRTVLAGLLGSMTAYLVQNQFSFGVVAITSFFWMMIGMTASIAARDEATVPSGKLIEKPDFVIPIMAWALIIAAVYVSSFPYIADKFYKTAKIEADSNMLEQSNADYGRAMEYSAYEGLYYTNHGMAVMNLRTGNKEEDIKSMKRAISIFEKGQKADPYNADNFYMAARAYLMLNDAGAGNMLPSAESLSRRTVKIDPYYAEAYQNLGYITERKGDLEEAIKMYEKAYISNPTLTDVGKAIYRYYRMKGIPQKAAETFDKVLAQNPDNPALLMMIGDLYQDTGMYEKAKSYYEQLLSASSSDVRALTGMGQVYVNTGELKKAYDIFQIAMISDPAYPPLHIGMGVYYLKKGDIKNARQELEQAVSLDPNNESAARLLKSIK